MDVQALEQNHPELLASIRAEAAEDAAKSERDRIQAVFNTPLAKYHSEVINEMAFDGKSTPAEAALAILAAEEQAKGQQVDDMRADASEDVVENTDAPVVVAADPEAKWDADEDLRAEFGDDKELYLNTLEAENKGLVRVLGGKK